MISLPAIDVVGFSPLFEYRTPLGLRKPGKPVGRLAWYPVALPVFLQALVNGSTEW
jgi:hypothetical protein